MALSDNIVAYWKLDESSGNATDATGNGYTLTNTNTVSYTTGKINNCATTGTGNTNKRLNGTSDLGIAGNGNQTFSAWINVNEQPATNAVWRFLDHRDGGTGDMVHIQYIDVSGTKKLEFTFERNGTQAYTKSVTTTLTTGTWYHVAVTYNGSQVEGFLNGSSQGTTAGSGLGSGITDGFSLFATANGFLFGSMKIDEVGAWSRVLSSTEISELYNSGNGLQYPFSTTSIKTINGLAKASVKTVDGLAIASVKSFNGLT